MRRATLPLVAVALLASACSSGPSLTEYAADAEAAVVTHNDSMDENDRDFENQNQTLEVIQTYATRRMELRATFLSALEELEPPREAKDLHNAALATIRSVVDAERVLFDRALEATDPTQVGDLWSTPAGQAAREADAQAIAICQAAEAAINSTEDRQALIGMPWVPSELQEVVSVAFGCTAADR